MPPRWLWQTMASSKKMIKIEYFDLFVEVEVESGQCQSSLSPVDRLTQLIWIICQHLNIKDIAICFWIPRHDCNWVENDLYTLYLFRGKVKVKHEYFSLCPSALPNLHGRTTWLRALQHPGDKIKHTFTSFFLKWWPFQGPGRESVAWCIPRGYEVTKPPFLCELGCNQSKILEFEL